MFKAIVVLVLAQAVMLVGSSEVARVAASSTKSESPALIELRKKANRLYADAAFSAAAELYVEGYQRALSAHAWNSAIKFLNNLGSARFAAYQYQAALDAYLRARKLASQHGDNASSGAISQNLSALYMSVGDLASSRAAIQQALEETAGNPNFLFRPQLLAQAGFVKSREGDAESAAGYFRQAIQAASQAGEPAVLSTVLQTAGEEFYRHGRHQEAELHLTEAFRLRKMFRDRQVRATYLSLSRLKLAQGDIRSAASLIEQADSLPMVEAGPPAWAVPFQLGQVRRAQGRIREAADSFRQAVQFAREWRQEAAPSDLSGSGTDIGLHRLYQALIDTSLELPEAPLQEMFVSAEEDKAASLRQALITTRKRNNNGSPEYWERLAQLRRAQARIISDPSAEASAKVDRLRYELNEMEAADRLYVSKTETDRAIQQSGNALKRIQRSIGSDETLLSLYRGERRCYLWAVTREEFEYHELQPGSVIEPLAKDFRTSVAGGSASLSRAGEKLYSLLFGALGHSVLAKSRWLITTQDDLFELPFSALVVRFRPEGPRYLVEEHSTERIPSALLLSLSPENLPEGKFVGIGDGVYNTADPRWVQGPPLQSPIQLARLVASGQELKNCAAQWHGKTELLTGPNASRAALEAAMRVRPAVIHVAAHFLYPGDKPDQALIDLGLGHSGESEVLTREDIGNLSVPGAMVILSGCSSAAMRSAPGAGLMGLTRAWLIAGAAIVIGSQWPTPDDTGELFKSFYQRLYARRGETRRVRQAADDLQSAQKDMLHSNTWRSNASYWAAFYAVGKE